MRFKVEEKWRFRERSWMREVFVWFEWEEDEKLMFMGGESRARPCALEAWAVRTLLFWLGNFFKKNRARPRALRRGQCACFWSSGSKFFQVFYIISDMYLQNK